MPALLAWWLGLAPALWAESPTDCPAAVVVEAKLRETLGMPAELVIEESVEVAREGEQLRVTAHSKDRRLLGERLLPAQGTCDELAGAVAVVLATWISDEHPEYVSALPVAETVPAQPAPEAPTPALPVAAVSTIPVDRSAEPAAASKPSQTRHFSFGASLGADFSSDGAVPVGTLGARWMPERWGLGAALSAVINGARRVELSTGNVRYFRWPLLLGPALRVPVGRAQLDVHAGAALAWLRVEGFDFAGGTNRHDAFTSGGFASARMALGSSSLSPFAELSGVLWAPTEAFIHQGDSEPGVQLPQLEIYAAFGAAWQLP